MSSLGRVIYGMQVVQSLNRARLDEPGGVIADAKRRSKIQWAKMAKQIPAAQRITIEIQKDDSELAQQRLSSAKTMDSEFYHFKGNGNLDLCYYQLRTRVLPSDK